MERKQISTINFKSICEDDNGVFIINKINKTILLSVSLKNNGDIEVSFDKESCQKLITALNAAIEEKENRPGRCEGAG
jgi:hypothetical protein